MLSVDQTLMVGFQLIAAVILAMPIAWHREAHSRIVGLRTFPLVSLGACSYIILGSFFIDPEASDAMARVVQGLLSGIGFVGGGAILKHDDHVTGTASAASIWVTGALGAAVGFQQWSLAIMLSVLNFLVVWILSGIKKTIPTEEDGL